MVEDIIKAKIVFDDASFKRATQTMTGGPSGGSGGGGGFADIFAKTAFAQDFPVWGDILAGVGGAVLLLRAIFDIAKVGFKKLIEASPHLQATMNVLAKTVQLTLRPIADVISLLLRPLIISWLRVVLPIYKRWREWFGDSGGKDARIEIGAGFTQIKEGLFELDFEKMFKGFGTVFTGFKNLFTSFFGEVLQPQFQALYDWWGTAQEKFNTSGIFDTIGAILKDIFLNAIEFLYRSFGLIGESDEITSFGEAVSTVLTGAWDTLTGLIDSVDWEKMLGPFYPALQFLWELFGTYLNNLGESWWAGPIAPFVAAFKTAWDEIVGPMIDVLIEALDAKLPGVRQAIEAIFTAGKGISEGGFFSSWIETGEKFVESVLTGINPALDNIYRVAKAVIGKNAKDKGSNVIGAFNATTESMNMSEATAQDLIMTLNRIPRKITTTHVIRTIKRSE